ncbi:MAG: hypothetical protein R2715_19045 [Ilumatobacteraceae bacterium]
MSGEDAGHPRADHHDVHRAARRHLGQVPIRRPAVLPAIRELLFEEREVGPHLGAADGELHDPQQLVVARCRRRHRAAVPEPDDRCEGQVLDRGLLLVGEAALRLGSEQRVGAQLVAEQRQVAGEIRERRQQRWEHRLVERGPQLVVGRRDRLDPCDERTR